MSFIVIALSFNKSFESDYKFNGVRLINIICRWECNNFSSTYRKLIFDIQQLVYFSVYMFVLRVML